MTRRQFENDKWEPWFAWRPVRLLGTFRFAWLRRISRRTVLTQNNKPRVDYSDTPTEYPAGYGRRHDIGSSPRPSVMEPRRVYRGYDLELKCMSVGWQISITKNDAFIRHSNVLADQNAVMAEAHSYIDSLIAKP